MTEPEEEQHNRRADDPLNRRKNDRITSRIEQKLDDFIAASKLKWDEHTSYSNKISDDHETRLKVLERLLVSIERPVKWVGWTVTLFFTGGLLYLGDTCVKWVVKHFHF